MAEIDANLIVNNSTVEKFSNGQLHRLQIARALFRESSILIIDEFDSYLEEETVEKILQNINNEKKNRITIVIGHNCNSEMFDHIFDVDFCSFDES